MGQKINKETHRGEWNAVLIDGNWRLVNTFWGSCVLAGDSQQDYWYTCDENFFLTGISIFSHSQRSMKCGTVEVKDKHMQSGAVKVTFNENGISSHSYMCGCMDLMSKIFTGTIAWLCRLNSFFDAS